MVNLRLAETGILKSEPETKKCSDLIEKHRYGRQKQNLRLRDPLVGSVRFRDLAPWIEFAETLDFQRTIHHPL